MTFRELYQALLDATPGSTGQILDVSIYAGRDGPVVGYTAHAEVNGRRFCVYNARTADEMLNRVRAEVAASAPADVSPAANAARIDALGEAA